jgi:hypothetical protein
MAGQRWPFTAARDLGSRAAPTKGLTPRCSRSCYPTSVGAVIVNPMRPIRQQAFNTTEHLLADMEALREHLGIDR